MVKSQRSAVPVERSDTTTDGKSNTSTSINSTSANLRSYGFVTEKPNHPYYDNPNWGWEIRYVEKVSEIHPHDLVHPPHGFNAEFDSANHPGNIYFHQLICENIVNYKAYIDREGIIENIVASFENLNPPGRIFQPVKSYHEKYEFLSPNRTRQKIQEAFVRAKLNDVVPQLHHIAFDEDMKLVSVEKHRPNQWLHSKLNEVMNSRRQEKKVFAAMKAVFPPMRFVQVERQQDCDENEPGCTLRVMTEDETKEKIKSLVQSRYPSMDIRECDASSSEEEEVENVSSKQYVNAETINHAVKDEETHSPIVKKRESPQICSSRRDRMRETRKRRRNSGHEADDEADADAISLRLTHVSSERNCVETLRHLFKKKIITKAEKSKLLNEMVLCKYEEKKSKVLIAYELVCFDWNENDLVEEEFAIQCRKLATRLG